MDFSDINFSLLIASLIVAATPILLAALGELVAEKSGVLNLGVCPLYSEHSCARTTRVPTGTSRVLNLGSI